MSVAEQSSNGKADAGEKGTSIVAFARLNPPLNL